MYLSLFNFEKNLVKLLEKGNNSKKLCLCTSMQINVFPTKKHQCLFFGIEMLKLYWQWLFTEHVLTLTQG